MSDDLERRLRDGLRRGTLPAAPEALRDRLSRLPAEGRASRWTAIAGGLRLAGLATAAAVAIAFVLVVRSLPGPTGGPGTSLGSAATTGTSASPTFGPTIGPTSAPTSAPSSSPTLVPVSPSARPSAAPGFSCVASTVLPATTSAVVKVTDVRVGTHAGYDRIVFEFSGTGRPRLTVAVASPPFVEDASGQTVNVPGTAFLSLKLFDSSGYPTYKGPSSFSPGYANLVALVNTGDFEGYVTWIAGLKGSACYRISTLTSPTRIVVDVQAP